MSESVKQNDALVKALVALSTSFASSITVKTLAAPLDRAKIIQQTKGLIDSVPEHELEDTISILKTLIAREGALDAFFHGNSLNFARYFVSIVSPIVLLAVQPRVIKATSGYRNQAAKFVMLCLRGGIIGSSLLVLSYPLDYVATRLASDIGPKREFSGIVDCVKKTVRAEGIQGLYAGYALSSLSIVAYRALYFGIYDTLQLYIRKAYPQNVPLWVRFLSAQMVVTTAGLATYPLDTVRRRLMKQQGKSVKKYNGAWHCFKTMIEEEGVSSLFAGAFSNFLRTIASSAIFIGFDVVMAPPRKR